MRLYYFVIVNEKGDDVNTLGVYAHGASHLLMVEREDDLPRARERAREAAALYEPIGWRIEERYIEGESVTVGTVDPAELVDY